jgi:beta-lactam-binding protein with PASTA domain
MGLIRKLFRSRGFYLIITSLIVAGAGLLWIANGYILPEYTRHEEGVSVPDVTRISYDEAVQRLEASGLRYELATRRAQSTYPANYVLDQDPKPLKIVKPNRKVYLTINSETRPKAVVPNVTNMSLRNATIQIENSGLMLGTITYESNRFRNTVLRQSLAPGDTVAKGIAINLIVSDGLGDKIVQVPDVTGLLLPEAQQALRSVGLRIDEIRFQPSRDFTPNTVLSYSPQVEELIEGQSVSLIVSEQFGAVEVTESGAINVADSTLQQ